MTAAEKMIAKALCYDVVFYPGTREARFILHLGEMSDQEETPPLTEKQRSWMLSILHKYRRQIPALHKTFCTDPVCQKQMKDQAQAEKTQLCLF